MSGNQEIREYFDEMAIGRDEAIAANHVIDYEQRVRSRMVLELLQPQAGERILDVGCGTGRDLPQLVARGCRCVAIDYSPTMVEETRQKLAARGITGLELEVGDATSLRFPDASFDKVFSSEVIEHIPRWEAAVREMGRVLRPGGVLVLTTPNRHSLYGFERYALIQGLLRRKWNHPCDEWKTRGEVRAALVASGLEPQRWAGVCYVPGFAVSYRLPRPLQRLVVGATSLTERPLSRALPGFGYMLAVRAVKPR